VKTYVSRFEYVDGGALVRIVGDRASRKIELGDLQGQVDHFDEPGFFRAIAGGGAGIEAFEDGLEFDDGTELNDSSAVEIEVGPVKVDPLGLTGDIYSYALTVRIPPEIRWTP
jgi:hypothetical protein